MQSSFSAFCGSDLLATGDVNTVSSAVTAARILKPEASILIFDNQSGRQMDLPLPSSPKSDATRSGRPRLGVVGREVTLLPRHWDWLNRQPGGASVALRKLVEAASRMNLSSELLRQKREAVYSFMTAIGGNFPNYEEAIRALFGGDKARFSECLAAWPVDVRNQAHSLATGAFS